MSSLVNRRLHFRFPLPFYFYFHFHVIERRAALRSANSLLIGAADRLRRLARRSNKLYRPTICRNDSILKEDDEEVERARKQFHFHQPYITNQPKSVSALFTCLLMQFSGKLSALHLKRFQSADSRERERNLLE